ncbi:hypothetical protein MYCTH_94555 [Thermothelomyces thermophilus ATCC 42464]|uniref:Uncharacterized protein n=1 Tax=Thermothelomyces thermophilus (strain ATCC 42464 / BCRC 31852 / DSM 1799) TaxID=573729 RepID=G2QGT3_THET4|nr:uncharacterized protein MYCTH_94555 [Thermothelomyces thermophilus ATCC 42464]AEO59440.1 hypothetical protein MYCTH_94555 [Thermothelomyces thermophilus ATCC 42464]
MTRSAEQRGKEQRGRQVNSSIIQARVEYLYFPIDGRPRRSDAEDCIRISPPSTRPNSRTQLTNAFDNGSARDNVCSTSDRGLWTSCKLLQNSHRDHQKRSKLNFITQYPPGSSRTWTNSSKLSQCSCYWQEATPTLLRLLNQDRHQTLPISILDLVHQIPPTPVNHVLETPGPHRNSSLSVPIEHHNSSTLPWWQPSKVYTPKAVPPKLERLVPETEQSHT